MLTLLLAAALVVGATTAFVLTGHLKSEPPRVSRPVFAAGGFFSASCTYTDCSERGGRASFSFRLRKATRLDVLIVRDGRTVRTLANRWRVAADGGRSAARTCTAGSAARLTIACTWDGKTESGGVAPDGVYHVVLRLRSQGWTVDLPQAITLDSTPPTVTAPVPAGRTITPGLAGDRGRIVVRLTASEPVVARLDVYAVARDGSVGPKVFRTHFANPKAPTIGTKLTLTWDGLAWGENAKRRPKDSQTVPPGTYIVGWEVKDRAGNEVSAPSGTVSPGAPGPASVIRVSTLELTPAFEPVTQLPGVTFQRLSIAHGIAPATAGAAPASASVASLLHPAAGLYAMRATVRLPRGGTAIRDEPLAAPGTAATLAVLPTYTWQLRSGQDGNDDGFPDRPPEPISLLRPLGSGATKRLADWIAILGPWASRAGTGSITDAQIERSGVPRSARTIVLAGERVWTPTLVAALNRFARAGGRVVLRTSPLTRKATLKGTDLTFDPRSSTPTLVPTRAPKRRAKAGR
jgi:hypothetical protein